MRPLDVTDDGNRALFVEVSTGALALWDAGVLRPLTTSGSTVLLGKIVPATGAPVVLLQEGTAAARLFRFDPILGAGTQVDGAAPIVSNGFDADAGRVAWKSTDGIRVLDLTTSALLFIPQTPGRFNGPRLTSDGIYVGVAQQTSAGRPDKTRVYRVSDGELRRNLAYGELLPDGKWLVDTASKELVQASNGARVADVPQILERYVGTSVGPKRFSFVSTYRPGFNLGDLFSYRAVAPLLPATARIFFVPDSSWTGRFLLRPNFRKAGLENVSTWNEYRVDGSGPWIRLQTKEGTIITLPEGRHALDVRAADALGRTEAVSHRYIVNPDFTPPRVGRFVLGSDGPGRDTIMVFTDAVKGSITVKDAGGASSVKINGFKQPEGIKFGLFETMTPGQTYRISFTLQDEFGNSVTTPEKTYVR
ncbi:hypothetical protein EON81_08270 [bacterium]|nr:MAG: hypothetical protein EON81_08270 [bacterium]